MEAATQGPLGARGVLVVNLVYEMLNDRMALGLVLCTTAGNVGASSQCPDLLVEEKHTEVVGFVVNRYKLLEVNALPQGIVGVLGKDHQIPLLGGLGKGQNRMCPIALFQ